MKKSFWLYGIKLNMIKTVVIMSLFIFATENVLGNIISSNVDNFEECIEPVKMDNGNVMNTIVVVDDRVLLLEHQMMKLLGMPEMVVGIPGETPNSRFGTMAIYQENRALPLVKKMGVIKDTVKTENPIFPTAGTTSVNTEEEDPGKLLVLYIKIGVLGLLAVLILVLWYVQKNRAKKERFIFEFAPIGIQDGVQHIQELKSMADKSMKFDYSDTSLEISFEVNKVNASLFVTSKEHEEMTFFQMLKSIIENAKEENLPLKQKKSFDAKLKQAKAQLEDVEKFAISLGGCRNDPQRNEELERYKQAFQDLKGVAKGIPDDELEKIVSSVKQSAQNWEELKRQQKVNSLREISEKLKQLDDKAIRSEEKIEELNKCINALNKDKEKLNGEVGLWKEETGFESPNKVKRHIGQLNENITQLNNKVNGLSIEKGNLETLVDRIKKRPESFKNDEKEFKNLAQLVVKAESYDELNDNPRQIDPSSVSGKLIAKGYFLEEAKNNVRLFVQEDKSDWFAGTELIKTLDCLIYPERILLDKNRSRTGLYKLVNDLEDIDKAIHKNAGVDLDGIASHWLKSKLQALVDGYNQYIMMKDVAAKYGTDAFDTSKLQSEVKRVYDASVGYLRFESYKNYWRNIVSPVFTTLDTLQKHDEVYNFRTLLFYTSQFHSIACIMNDIYGNNIYSITRPKNNTNIFNGNSIPAISRLGFPELDKRSLNDCRFEYKGAEDEDAKVKFLKAYKPLPFIIISSYFDDSILS